MQNFDVKTLYRFIRKKSWKELRAAMQELDHLQLAEAIDRGSEFESIVLFRFLSRAQAKEVFQELSHDKQEDIVQGLAEQASQVADLLNDMEPDDRTAFLEELPGEVAQRLMQLLTPDNRAVATRLLGYPEDSIGRLMTPEYVAVRPHFTVEETLAHIRQYGHDSETLNVIYVVDDKWQLLDGLRIREVILASPEQRISDLMDYKYDSLNAFDDQEAAVTAFKKYDRVVLPVVDTKGILLGIVTVDDILDIAEEEGTEDFQKFGAVQDAIISPLQATVSFLYRKRVLWLLALVFVNVFSGAVIQNFENVLAQTLSLVFFLPLLIDSGGNAGSQSATLMIRALAVGDVQLRDWTKLLGKELIVSLLLGLTMALGVSFISAFRAPEIMLVLAITMTAIVMVGSLIGMLLPFIFTKLKMDPATASAPLITSLADILGVLIYFTVASRLLG